MIANVIPKIDMDAQGYSVCPGQDAVNAIHSTGW